MIIAAGIPTEDPVDLVIKSAEKFGIDCLVFNQRKAYTYDLNYIISKNRQSGFLYLNGTEINLQKIDGIFFRMIESAGLPENNIKLTQHLSETDRTKLNFVNDLFTNICDILTCRIANRPRDMNSNFSKIYQARFILEAGLKIPRTLVTNLPDQVIKMKKMSEDVIFKSVSSVRSIVKRLDHISEPRLKNLRYLPTQFQECLKGSNIRVHVVGDNLFASEIQSQSIDYRYASSDGNDLETYPCSLPEGIKSKCFQLSKMLSLPLCGIDLFKSINNEYYCFEINPCPGYSYYQNMSGDKISDAIVKYLEYGTAKE